MFCSPFFVHYGLVSTPTDYAQNCSVSSVPQKVWHSELQNTQTHIHTRTLKIQAVSTYFSEENWR